MSLREFCLRDLTTTVTRQMLGGGDDLRGRLIASLHSHTDGCKCGVMVECSEPDFEMDCCAEWFSNWR